MKLSQNGNNVRRIGSSNRCDRELIDNASVPQLLALVEIAANVVKARAPIHNNRLIPKLVEQADSVRALSRARTPRVARKILMMQRGRGIPAIAGLLASAVIPLLSHIIKSKFGKQ